MGRQSSIDEATGKKLIAAYGRLKSLRKAAAEVGVSKDAASRFFATLPKAAASAVAAPVLPSEPLVVQSHRPAPAPTLVDAAQASLWDTKAVLEENYRRITRLAEQLDQGILEDKNGQLVVMTPVAVNVAAIKEIREHIKTSMELLKLLVDVDEVRKFQQTVIEAIGEADEPTKQRILVKLRERRALGLTLSGH